MTKMPKTLYLCGENTICITDYCEIGKELDGPPEIEYLIINEGTYTESKLTAFGAETYLKFRDGSTEIKRNDIKFVIGCENKKLKS